MKAYAESFAGAKSFVQLTHPLPSTLGSLLIMLAHYTHQLLLFFKRVGFLSLFLAHVLELSAILMPLTAQAQPTNDSTFSITTVRLGYTTSLEPHYYINVVVPLLEQIKQQLPNQTIQSQEITFEQLNSSLDNDFDFLLLSGAEAQMLSPTPLSLATLQLDQYHDLNHAIGSVFMVKANSPIHSFSDMKGKTVVATDEHSFEGWLIALNELIKSGIDPQHFFYSTHFTHWQFPDVLTLVQSGVKDVGVLSTCSLERAMAQGAITKEDFRIIAEKNLTSGEVCRRSTELYPGLQLLALSHVPPSLVKDVLIAALTLPKSPEGTQWLPNNDNSRLDQLLENLKIGPYAYLNEFTPRALWARYKVWILALLGALFVFILDFIRIKYIVKRRTAQLARETEIKVQTQKDLDASRRRLDLLERASVVSQMSAMIAHDLKQPLTIMVNYLNGMKVLLKQKRYQEAIFQEAVEHVSHEAYRLSTIINHVREVNQQRWAEKRELSVSEILKHVKETAQLDDISFDIPHNLWVLGNSLELELVIINLIRNARAASRSPGGGGQVWVRAFRQEASATMGATVHICVEDNGPTITDEVFHSLGHLTKSSKADGMGYGLVIANSIVEAHQGHLLFERCETQGLSASLVLPALPEPTKDLTRQ